MKILQQRKRYTISHTLFIRETMLGVCHGQNVHYYLSRERTGAMALGEGVEGYLIAKCGLTRRLLSAAQSLMEDVERIPNDIDINEFLLVVVHKKDWAPPKILEASVSDLPPPPMPEATVSDPRIRAGLKPVVPAKREHVEVPMQSLPSGLTLESISNLAAMLGVQRTQPMPSTTSNTVPSTLPPHQMTVPGAAVPPISLPAMETQQQQQQNAVVVQPERPKFLIFDPLTNKAVPLNPGSVQYDPGSNRILIVGPLPQGFAIQQLTNTVVDTPSVLERSMALPQGMIPVVMKTAPGASIHSRCIRAQ